MADVFVSYASEDRERIKPIVEAIEQAGFTVWWDRRIGLGTSFDREIERELEAAACVAVIWSEGSIQSDWVRNEAQEGLDRGVLLPILIDNVRPPLAFRRAQAAQLVGRVSDDELNRVVSSIETIVTGTTASVAIRHDGNSSRSRWPQYLSGLVVITIFIVFSYWWVGRVEPDAGNWPTDGPTESSLAVLPFTNLSSDPEQEYFSEGVSEDILDGLARTAGIVVRAKQSSFRFNSGDADPSTIANQLNVSYLVSGTVRAVGPRVRVTARLTDVGANMDVWSDRYDRELSDIFAVQDEIAEAVVTALGAHFSSVERKTVNIDAYRAYLAGRYHQYRFEIDVATDFFQQAIELDPTYANAYAALAQIYGTQADGGPEDFVELHAKQREFIAKALEYDANQPLARGLDAWLQPAKDAIPQLDSLIRLNPNNMDLLLFYSFVMRRVGKFDLELRTLDKMAALDPLSPLPFHFRGNFYASLGKTEAAKADYRKCESLGMPNPALGAQIAILDEDIETAKLEFNRPWPFSAQWRLPLAAIAAFLEGDRDSLTSILEQLDRDRDSESFHMRLSLAPIRGEADAAPEYLRSALERGETYALRHAQGTALSEKLLPDFYGSEQHVAILAEYALDADSIAKLSIPPVPF